MTDWQQRLACRPTHAAKIDGVWHRGTHDSYGWLVTRAGRIQIKIRCTTCGEQYGNLPFDVWAQWREEGSELDWCKTNEPGQYEPCTYRDCFQQPTERHHFAPYNTFGGDAEKWPCLPLCREHHQQWHRTMDGYQWHRRGIWRDTA